MARTPTIRIRLLVSARASGLHVAAGYYECASAMLSLATGAKFGQRIPTPRTGFYFLLRPHTSGADTSNLLRIRRRTTIDRQPIRS